jgi:3-methyladenine DNA glycosylase/8-oxoguanine DNA glycosylase
MGKQYGENLYQYPKLENITETAVNQLSISTNKKKSLLEIKEYFTHSAADTTNLINIFGVGNWTVDWFALKCLNKTNTIPAGDLKVRKTFSKFFNDEKYTDSKQLKVLEEKLYPIGGLLAHCLLLEFS